MTIILVGGGPDTVTIPAVFDRFVRELRHRAPGRVPRVAVVLFDHEGSSEYFLPAYVGPLESRIDCKVLPVLLRFNKEANPAAFDDVDGIVVGGGPTPAYLEGLLPSAVAIRRAVSEGVPYMGFSAGAMVAPARAIVGGYRIRGTEVCAMDCSEGLEEVEIRDGLGLVPFAVDVHAAQAGTLSRAVGAVAKGLVDHAAAVDENTALVLHHADLQQLDVIGTGNCWTIRGAGPKATVSVLSAHS
ncbi:cyanophycinase [Arthrobacter sp. ok909]|uniref:Type 1 glutamine amidotransferase-like domain-containing protein n=1 Tax=Arthrobacter sp. ok909 TaxID=1761746 RepID=UPI00088331E0|nr:Type 1 glutamine amidotransferase-like domain-containing protein [Arthrobacter sp. ok909]SDP75523.1 cyanophycinase [Arthrobacter sp. ok909]